MQVESIDERVSDSQFQSPELIVSEIQESVEDTPILNIDPAP